MTVSDAPRFVRVTFGVIGLGCIEQFYDRASEADREAWSRNERDLRHMTLSIAPATEAEYKAGRSSK